MLHAGVPIGLSATPTKVEKSEPGFSYVLLADDLALLLNDVRIGNCCPSMWSMAKSMRTRLLVKVVLSTLTLCVAIAACQIPDEEAARSGVNKAARGTFPEEGVNDAAVELYRYANDLRTEVPERLRACLETCGGISSGLESEVQNAMAALETADGYDPILSHLDFAQRFSGDYGILSNEELWGINAQKVVSSQTNHFLWNPTQENDVYSSMLSFRDEGGQKYDIRVSRIANLASAAFSKTPQAKNITLFSRVLNIESQPAWIRSRQRCEVVEHKAFLHTHRRLVNDSDLAAPAGAFFWRDLSWLVLFVPAKTKLVVPAAVRGELSFREKQTREMYDNELEVMLNRNRYLMIVDVEENASNRKPFVAAVVLNQQEMPALREGSIPLRPRD